MYDLDFQIDSVFFFLDVLPTDLICNFDNPNTPITNPEEVFEFLCPKTKTSHPKLSNSSVIIHLKMKALL